MTEPIVSRLARALLALTVSMALSLGAGAVRAQDFVVGDSFMPGGIEVDVRMGQLDAPGTPLDLVVLSSANIFVGTTLRAFLGIGGGRFTAPIRLNGVPPSPTHVELVDVDGDGLDELVLGFNPGRPTSPRESIQVLDILPQGAGLATPRIAGWDFGPVPGGLNRYNCVGLAAGDFTGDGRIDLAFAGNGSGAGTTQVLLALATRGPGNSWSANPPRDLIRQAGAAPIEELRALRRPDGTPDELWLSRRVSAPGVFDRQIEVLLDIGTGTGTRSPVALPTRIAGGQWRLGDIDGDRWPDLVSVAPSTSEVRVDLRLASTGTRTTPPGFVRLATIPTPNEVLRGAPLIADVDADGLNDLVAVLNTPSAARVVVAEGRTVWSGVRAVGPINTTSNGNPLELFPFPEGDGWPGDEAWIGWDLGLSRSLRPLWNRTATAHRQPGTLDRDGRHRLRLGTGFNRAPDGVAVLDVRSPGFLSVGIDALDPALVGAPVGILAHLGPRGQAAPARGADGLWLDVARAFWFADPSGGPAFVAPPLVLPAAGWIGGLNLPNTAPLSGLELQLQALAITGGRVIGSDAHLLRF